MSERNFWPAKGASILGLMLWLLVSASIIQAQESGWNQAAALLPRDIDAALLIDSPERTAKQIDQLVSGLIAKAPGFDWARLKARLAETIGFDPFLAGAAAGLGIEAIDAAGVAVGAGEEDAVMPDDG